MGLNEQAKISEETLVHSEELRNVQEPEGRDVLR